MFLFLLTFALCSFIQGLFSFGGGMILIPILSNMFSVKLFLIPLISLYNLYTNFFTCLNYRSINIFKYKKLLLWGTLGNIIGATFLLNYCSEDHIKIILALAIIINSIFSKLIKKTDFSKYQFLSGFSSGLLGGSIGLGNLGLVLVYGKNDAAKLKSLIAQFCLFQNIITFIIYMYSARYNILIILYLIPAILICSLFQKIGIAVSNKLNAQSFTFIMNIFLLLIATYLLLITLFK